MADGRVLTHVLQSVGLDPSVVTDPQTAYDLLCAAPTVCSVASSKLVIFFPFPFLIAAVDPASEAALSGLEGAVIQGDYLAPGAPQSRTFQFADGTPDERLVLPVLVADKPTNSLSVSYVVRNLGAAAAASAAASGSVPARPDATAPIVAQGSVDSATIYQRFLAAMATPTGNGEYYARSVLHLNRTGGLAATQNAGVIVVQGADANVRSWWGGNSDIGEAAVPPGGDDRAFRTMAGYERSVGGPSAALVRVGTFDASLLAGASLGRVPLGTYAFHAPTGADETSRAALGDTAWRPSANLWGFVQAPPLMITTLDALSIFSGEGWAQIDPKGGPAFEGIAPVGSMPLSAVRVRVAGVTGFDAVAREKVRLVAEDIAKSTGLTVDIVLGSSGSHQEVSVPAGTHGRPALLVDDLWVKKGVAVELIAAADRKSLLLNAGILAVSGVVVNNAVFAEVRSRRRQIGVLRTTGWTAWNVFAWILGGVLLASLVSGLVGAGTAWGVSAWLGLALDGRQALWAIPAAVVVGLLAAVVPAVSASSVPALEATFPAGTRRRSGRLGRVWGRPGMALRALRLGWGRSLLGVLALATATAALGVLWGIQAEFNGRAVGTLLGDAVTLQVRQPDLWASLGLFALAGIGVAHVLGIQVRERATELATLRATGWRTTSLIEVLGLQGLALGLFGAAVGGGAALAFDLGVLGTGGAVGRWALAAGGVGVLTALAAVVVPAVRLGRQRLASVLAED